MSLSAADRAALRARAEGLRAEVSSLKSERDVAVDEASTAVDDAKLLAEVARLEAEKDAAIASRDTARGTVADAMAVMEAAAQTANEAAGLIVAPAPTGDSDGDGVAETDESSPAETEAAVNTDAGEEA